MYSCNTASLSIEDIKSARLNPSRIVLPTPCLRKMRASPSGGIGTDHFPPKMTHLRPNLAVAVFSVIFTDRNVFSLEKIKCRLREARSSALSDFEFFLMKLKNLWTENRKKKVRTCRTCLWSWHSVRFLACKRRLRADDPESPTRTSWDCRACTCRSHPPLSEWQPSVWNLQSLPVLWSQSRSTCNNHEIV